MTTPLLTFEPPGELTDFDEKTRKKWHRFVSDVIDKVMVEDGNHTNDSPRAQFFNPSKTKVAADVEYYSVTWLAFPRIARLTTVGEVERWRAADETRDIQDEYCEWSVTRNADKKIIRVDFTCEGPEYWAMLAENQPEKVVALYQEFVSSKVKKADLFNSEGEYIPRNVWNDTTTGGAMHLVQRFNTLVAQLNLGAAATIVRKIDGREKTGEQELIECSKYGDSRRNSDPHIGGQVNSVARRKADIAAVNPVGLYFDDLFTTGWACPDGSDPKSYWRYDRGVAPHPVRAVYEVPEGKPFTVGDITMHGKKIDFGSQIADCISMKMICQGCRFEMSTVEPFTVCAERIKKNTAIPGLSARFDS